MGGDERDMNIHFLIDIPFDFDFITFPSSARMPLFYKLVAAVLDQCKVCVSVFLQGACGALHFESLRLK